MEPRKYNIKAKLPKAESLRVNEKDKDVIKMKISQLPVVSNDATTGHKLQGRGVDQLFVHNWSYVTNWPYVMLSRVKTMAGLLCRSKLSTDLRKYAMPVKLHNLIQRLKRKKPTLFTEEDYSGEDIGYSSQADEEGAGYERREQ